MQWVILIVIAFGPGYRLKAGMTEMPVETSSTKKGGPLEVAPFHIRICVAECAYFSRPAAWASMV